MTLYNAQNARLNALHDLLLPSLNRGIKMVYQCIYKRIVKQDILILKYIRQKSSAHLGVLKNSVLIWNRCIIYRCLEKSFCSNLMNSKRNSVTNQRNTPHLKGLGITHQKRQKWPIAAHES